MTQGTSENKQEEEIWVTHPEICHYTSFETVIPILDSQALWATHFGSLTMWRFYGKDGDVTAVHRDKKFLENFFILAASVKHCAFLDECEVRLLAFTSVKLRVWLWKVF